MKHTLGLDISTKIIAWTIYDHESNKIVKFGIINVDKYDNLIAKFELIEQHLTDVYNTYPVSNIIIEMYKLGFLKSSIQTLINLSSINNFTTYTCFKLWNMLPDRIVDITARKQVWGSIPKHLESVKDFIADVALLSYPQLQTEVYEYVKQEYPDMLNTRGANKGQLLSTYKDCWKDVVDSLTMAKFKILK